MAPLFPRFDYTMRDVRRAGEALATDLIWTDETAEAIRQVFRVANNFRDSHAYPMRRIRYDLSGRIRRNKITEGFTVARLKRMPSIRRKLRKLSSNLNQIQDLAGCRAVLPAMDDVNALITSMRSTSHTLHREDDYINHPKPDGYRSHHMVFKFRGVGEEDVYNDRRVEVQIRTRLQHSWATAVEAVGLFRREDLKAGQGSEDWLKLFRLMSVEFLLMEGCSVDKDGRHDRLAEIIQLNKQLDAMQTLENLRQAVKITEDYQFDPKNRPDYFLIRYDRSTNRVHVRAQYGPQLAVTAYDQAESIDPNDTNNGFNTVLVEVDEVDTLKAAYPNYFGDVELFRSKLGEVTGLRDEFRLEPQPSAPKRPREKPDPSWLHKPKRWE